TDTETPARSATSLSLTIEQRPLSSGPTDRSARTAQCGYVNIVHHHEVSEAAPRASHRATQLGHIDIAEGHVGLEREGHGACGGVTVLEALSRDASRVERLVLGAEASPSDDDVVEPHREQSAVGHLVPVVEQP